VATRGLHEAAAALFVDALGRDLPLREHFSFGELHTFLRREGILGLDRVDSPDLISISAAINELTHGNIRVSAEPTPSAARTPLSTIDLRVGAAGVDTTKPETVIGLTDLVALQDGTTLHVVAIQANRYVGMDDQMAARVFSLPDVATVTPMDAPL
jgi:hypothetical protein